MLIFDGDYPMAYSALDMNRDLTLSVESVRQAEANSGNMVLATLPEMRRGRIAGALVKVVGRIERESSPLWGYRSGDLAHAAARGQLAFYQVLAARGETRILQTRSQFNCHMEEWAGAAETAGRAVGVVLGMEGADPILWPEQLSLWWDWGLRVVSLTHYGPSSYAHGTGCPGGLFPPARPLLAEMERTGMILDLTHISDEGFWQALQLFQGPGPGQPPELPRSGPWGTAVLGPAATSGHRAGRSDRGLAGHLDAPPHPEAGLGHPRNGPRPPLCKGGGDAGGRRRSHRAHLRTGRQHPPRRHRRRHGRAGRSGRGARRDRHRSRLPEDRRDSGKAQWKTEDIANVMHANWQRFFEEWLPN